MKNSKNKIIIILLALLLLAGLAFFAYRVVGGSQNSNSEEQGTNKKVEPVNTIPIKERPYTTIIPRSDGKEVTISVNNLKGYDSVEYELEYQAGTLLQGAFGKIEFNKDTPPVSRKILLGSCSAGGKCSYHENVNGGTLILRYLNGDSLKLKSEWNFQNMSEQAGIFSSRDGKFSFDVGIKGLTSRTFVVISQMMGLPGDLDGEIVAGPYQVNLPEDTQLNTKEVNLSVHTSSADPNLKLLGWNNNTWKEYEIDLQEKTLKATVDLPTVYVVVIPASSE